MKRRCLSIFLSFCLALTLFPTLSLPAYAYSTSDWVLESSAPAGAEITDKKWTYTKTTYADSKSTSMPGYTLSSSEWIQSRSGSTQYASFPTGYNTSNSYYTSMSKSAYTASESTTSKRTVSNSWAGYIYWHWAYNAAYYNTTARWISDRSQYAGSSRGLDNYWYGYFYAFKSTTNASKTTGFTYTWTANGQYDSSAVTYNCANCLPSGANTGATSGLNNPRFLRFDYYTSTYTDYYKLFHYYKTEQLESSTPISTSSSSTVVISNVKAYVKYKNSFTIKYDANGGTNAPASQTKSFGVPLTITSSVPTRQGYDFLGWSVSSNALAASYAPGSSFAADSDYTLYAIWQNKTRYVVTYDYQTNGGTSCSIDNDLVYQGENANLSVAASKDGWNFVGWNTDSTATSGLSSLTVTENTTLYAIFSKTVTAYIYIGANNLYSAMPQTYYNCAEGAVITLPQIPNYSDWLPVCWVRGSDNRDFAAGSIVSITDDTVFYAKYVKTLVLSYDANGGQSTPSEQLVALYYLADGSYDETEPALAGAITRQGYSFDKWAYGGENGNTYSAGDTLFLRENVVMYATWTELPTLETPSISIVDILGGKTVYLNTFDEGATIYYTIDGSSPTELSSLIYDAPIVIESAGQYTLKAVALKSGYTDSAVTVETITIDQAANPISNLESGYVRADVGIVLSSETTDGIIYYTTDGTIPTLESTIYYQPLFVSNNFTLKAITALPGYAVSECTAYEYKQAPVYSVDSFGYSFVNAATSFGYTSTMPSFLNYCIPYSSVKLIFGDSVKGKSAYTSMAKYAWSGNCCGMASTSSLIFSTSVDVTADSFGQTSVNRLRVTDSAAKYDNLLVRTFIEAMQISQYTAQFDRDYGANKVSNTQFKKGENINSLYYTVKSDLYQSKNDIIAVGQSGVGAHALLAYEIVDISSSESRLYVYDCNYPNDSNRYVTLWKDVSGNVIGWAYDMGRYGVWGTDSVGNSYISFIPYDTIEFIWNNRGRLFDNYLTLTVDSDNVAIYNLDRELVGEFRDGEFYTTHEDVFAIPNLSLSNESDLSVYLPEDFYVVTNFDGGDFEASMVGESIGATVSTNAETVCFELNESLRLNDISIEQAGRNSNYTISLDSSYLSTNNTAVFRNVTISGTGIGETMRLSSGASGTPIIENCNIGSYKINGVEQINYMITALAGSGGSITPKGDVSVPAGTSKTFAITPNSGYKIKDVFVDGYSIGAESSFTFEEIGRDHMIRATFEPAFSINDIQLRGQTLSINVSNDSVARLCAAVYSADGKMETVRFVDIARNSPPVQMSFDIELPQRCEIKVFLLSKTSLTPLCESKSYFLN